MYICFRIEEEEEEKGKKLTDIQDWAKFPTEVQEFLIVPYR